MNGKDFIGQILREKMGEQKWYQTYVNGAITVATLVVNVIWLAVSIGIDIDPEVIGAVIVTIQGLGALGVKFSTNGVTPKQIKELESYVGKHRAIEPDAA